MAMFMLPLPLPLLDQAAGHGKRRVLRSPVSAFSVCCLAAGPGPGTAAVKHAYATLSVGEPAWFSLRSWWWLPLPLLIISTPARHKRGGITQAAE